MCKRYMSDTQRNGRHLIDTGLSRIPAVDPVLHNWPCYHGSVEAHLRLLESGRIVIKHLAGDPRIRGAATPTLHYLDLHKGNVFVSNDDPAVITGIIDW
jgi:hypothetical protein